MIKFYEKYMLLIGGGGSLIFYLQAIKIFYEHNAAAISLSAFIVGLVSVVSWMVYGILIKNRILFISNVLATIGALFVVIGIIIYKN
jgi:MtN3 and saliva related transmembrane protein